MSKNSSNPTFRFSGWETHTIEGHSEPMTESGTLWKTLLLFLIMMASFFLTAKYMVVTELGGFGIMGNIILVLATLGIVFLACIKPKMAPFLAPIYAVLEGVFLGSVIMYSNYILEAFIITATIFFTLLFLYRIRIIRVSNGFVKLVFGLTLGVLVFYLLEISLISLGITDGSLLLGNGMIALLIAGFCLFVAVSNLLVDFRMIENGANYHLPKYMEFFFAMSLMISIVWVYVESLRILSILSDD